MSVPVPSPATRRRAAVQAGLSGDLPALRGHLSDPSARVRIAVLFGLARLGRVTRAQAARALADPAPEVRRAACELATGLPGAHFSALLGDPDASVVEAAAFAVGERGEIDALEPLARVAVGHADPLCREAAVAALGALGAGAALPAVLVALGDRAAVRRRATIALAAFEGPEVDAALRRALSDRDWQVRQAAEDLLGLSPEARPSGGGSDRRR